MYPKELEPVTIERDIENDRVTIEGVEFSGEFFRCLANPDPTATYRIEKREDGAIWITKLNN